MMVGVLAMSGSTVLIPDAVAMKDGPSDSEVQFVDAAGRTLVVFLRSDLSLVSSNPNSIMEWSGEPSIH
jgi:hypothetical protein